MNSAIVTYTLSDGAARNSNDEGIIDVIVVVDVLRVGTV